MRIGIDLGGTKIAGIALASDGTTRAEQRIATPRDDYAATLTAIAGLVCDLEARAGAPGTVGIGMPGAISPRTGLVKNANSVWLNGRPFAQDLERGLARPVRLENDANCLAVSEAVDGAGAGLPVVWAIILGTGVGSGIALRGRALSGRDRIAGEWGHNPLPSPRDDERPGPACYCGRHGCLETWVSGPALAADHARRTGTATRGEGVIAALRAGDAEARATVDRYLDRLGRGIAHGVNLIDPDVIVIGGGLSRVPEILAGLPERVAPHVFSDAFDTPIRPSRHGDASGVRGAAWLWNGP
ncbi:transcriptional regulator [Methylobacterium sp. Leaf111]|uniref:ROK family protein n=1 Tax=unclassified Methylobacterium TaxID=2615210 RepID=UPI000700D116|nr:MULTISPECIES: ROK family protein [unclassified Methylobacterium]KQO68194.1 transcriptional regulator [Methylobacterium sp. Leaf89]KQP76815.1 transcriptional regulator [Methylobacterium sp. Leaf111]KQU27531.1 transcriptional regulator [Methylobacterium sp. Leaf94]